MRRLLGTGAAFGAVLALAACGGESSSESTTPAAGSGTVAVKSIGGLSNVLVASSGKALYASDEEADGKVRCTGACTSFWKPFTVGSATPTAPPDAGRLDVTVRPDGARQATANGKLLYTFAEDKPGTLKGNGFSDEFGDQHLTWHAVLAGGRSAGAAGGSSGNGYGY
jgi:predicted lipoprotein with Yx(FWY)xxD motif